MRAVSVGLLIEEQRSDIAAAWKHAVEHDLAGEPALGFAVGPLLREMALALRGEEALTRIPRGAAGAAGSEPEATLRSAVLVRSGAAPARVAREFKLLHRALWQTLRAAGRIVGADERRVADEWLDDALAAALDRIDRVRTRAELLERPPERLVHVKPDPANGTTYPARPPPLPRMRPPAARPSAFPAPPSAPLGVE